jgi:hypothetical protein
MPKEFLLIRRTNTLRSLSRHLKQLAVLASSILEWRKWLLSGMRFRVSLSTVPVKGVSYAGKSLLVPSAHDKCANVVVALNDESIAEVIERCRSAFPHICSTQFYRPVKSYRDAYQKHCELRSDTETDNTRARQDLVTVALEVRAQWLR